MKYMGWANYDTWLVVSLLSNIDSNYYKIIEMERDEVLSLTVYDLQRYFDFRGEDIDFDNVDIDDIIDNIFESKYENV
jgi:hypothetical protein